MLENEVEQKFISAYDTYQNAIFRHCFFRVFERELARDLTQETFIKTWDYIQQGKEVKNMQAFLYKTATNLIIDYVRKKKEQSLDAMTDAGFQPSNTRDELGVLDAKMEVEELMNILDTLDDMYREPFLLRFVEGLKPKEIALVLNEDVNVISVRITRAKRQVIQKIKKNIQ